MSQCVFLLQLMMQSISSANVNSLLSHLLFPKNTQNKTLPLLSARPSISPPGKGELYHSFPGVELDYWYHVYCILIPLLMYHFSSNCYTVLCPSYSPPSLLQSNEPNLFKCYCSNNSILSRNISITLTSSDYAGFKSSSCLLLFLSLHSCSNPCKSLSAYVCTCTHTRIIFFHFSETWF